MIINKILLIISVIILIRIILQLFLFFTNNLHILKSNFWSRFDRFLTIVTIALIIAKILNPFIGLFSVIVSPIIIFILLVFKDLFLNNSTDLELAKILMCSARSGAGGAPFECENEVSKYKSSNRKLPHYFEYKGRNISARAFPADGTTISEKFRFIPAEYPKEWITDEDILKKLEGKKMMVHKGFLDAYKRYKKQYEMIGYPSRKRITERYFKMFPPDTEFYFGGLSGVGILGMFEAFELATNSKLWGVDRKKINVITFGSPAAGDRLFNYILDSTVNSNTRIITPLDIVPKSLENQLPHSGKVHVLPLTSVTSAKDLTYHTPNMYRKAINKALKG